MRLGEMINIKQVIVLHMALLTIVLLPPYPAAAESRNPTTSIFEEDACGDEEYVNDEKKYIENAIEFTIDNQQERIAAHKYNGEFVMLDIYQYTSAENFKSLNYPCCSITYKFGDFGRPPDWWIKKFKFKLIVNVNYFEFLLENGEEIREARRSIRYWMNACGSVMQNIDRFWEGN